MLEKIKKLIVALLNPLEKDKKWIDDIPRELRRND